jgi:hypothetical protein
VPRWSEVISLMVSAVERRTFLDQGLAAELVLQIGGAGWPSKLCLLLY